MLGIFFSWSVDGQNCVSSHTDLKYSYILFLIATEVWRLANFTTPELFGYVTMNTSVY
jgi:hypothetical protein